MVHPLLQQLPWLSERSDLDEAALYGLHGQLGTRLCRAIVTGCLSESQIGQGFGYLKHLAQDLAAPMIACRLEAHSLLYAVFAAILTESDAPIEAVRSRLEMKALSMFEELQESHQVIRSTFDRFPRFSERADMGDIEHYGILGQFALYLRDGISQRVLANEEVDNAFSFLNEMGVIAERNEEMETLLKIGVLEILTDTDESISVSREKLEGKALSSFEEAIEYLMSPE